jgi:site-specific recombinase XerD
VKTETSKRAVELGQVVAESLARHVELFPPSEVEIDDEMDPRNPVRRMARLLFVNGASSPIRRSGTWPRMWIPAVAQAGLPKGTGYHALRHYFATLLIHAGASVVTVQKALGHANPTTTLNKVRGGVARGDRPHPGAR